MNKLLIIFVKNPEIGRVKTRLAKSLGDEGALAVYLKLLTHTQIVTHKLPMDKAVYYTRYVDTEDNWENGQYKKFLQQGADLGERMHNAFFYQLHAGYDAVCLIGSDIYELKPEIIVDAFTKLENHDAVIGPAKDGGYYLIGLKKPNKKIFEIKNWSTPNVFSHTMRLIDEQNLSCAQTALLNDIDEISDLKGTDLV